MKPVLFAALLAFVPAAGLAQSCPPAPDREAEIDALLGALKVAPDPAEGQRLSNALWAIWADAPDDRAQELLDRGMARRESYDYAGAIEAFDALVAYCPEYAEGYNQRAFVNFLRGEYAAALTDLERALARNPRHVAAMSGQALTLMHMGRMKAGQSVLRDALALNPWLPERAYLVEPAGEDL